MDWIKIPTDNILYTELSDKDLLTIIRYQALYSQLEIEPSESQLQRVFSSKQIEFISKNKNIVKDFVEEQIKTVVKKRNKSKDRYNIKQCVTENSAGRKEEECQQTGGADKNRIDKNREDNPPIVPPKSERKSRARKPVTFITEEFVGDIKSIALCGKLGLDIDAEQRKFIDYWLAKGDARADWQASFRTWLDRAAGYRKEREQRQETGRQGPRDVVGAALRAAEVLRQREG